MSEKFTPGTWRAEGIQFINNSRAHVVAKNYLGELTDNDNHSVAVCDGPDKAANAALIAAAPDMYEALEYIHSELVVKTDGENYAYHMIEAALAKARGE